MYVHYVIAILYVLCDLIILYQSSIILLEKYNIFDGVYISPFTKSIFKDNTELIDGILMDTTWNI